MDEIKIKIEQFDIRPGTLLIAKMSRDAKEEHFVQAAKQIMEKIEETGIKTAKCLVVPHDFQLTDMDDDLLKGLGLRRIKEDEVDES